MNKNDPEQIAILMEQLQEIKTWRNYSRPYQSIGGMMTENKIMKEWAEQHMKGKYYNFFSLWYFELDSDYALFLLRWS